MNKVLFLLLLATSSCIAQDTLTFQDVDWDGLMDLTEDPCVDRAKPPNGACDDGIAWTFGDRYDDSCNCAVFDSIQDPIAQQLTTSLSAWNAAADSAIVEITQAEWDSIVANVTDVSVSNTYTTGGSYFTTGGGETWALDGASYEIPTGSYIIGFFIANGDTNTGTTAKTNIKQSSTSLTSGYSTILTFDFNWGLDSWFLVKGGVLSEADNGKYVAIFGGASFSRPLRSPSGKWNAGNSNTLGSTNGTSQEQEYMYFPHANILP